MGKILGHNRASGKESEHSIIGKIKSIMCIGLLLCLCKQNDFSLLILQMVQVIFNKLPLPENFIT